MIMFLFEKNNKKNLKNEYPPKLIGEALEKQQKLFAEIENKLVDLMKDPLYSFFFMQKFNSGFMTSHLS